MATIKEKTINRHKYLYAEHSFRLPNKKIKKISKLIKEKSDVNKKEIKEYFICKEKEAYKNWALKQYKTDRIFTKETIEEIENARVEYKRIKNKLTKNQLKDIIDRFTVNFTYESNAIEGNSLTLKDVTLILKENIVPKGKDLREIYETKNTRTVHDLLFSNKLKISRESIIKMHSLLVKDTGITQGFKKLPNYLLMRNVKTTPPEAVEKEMKNLVEWYNKNKQKIHPLKLAPDFHARFERIHPFEDGNGRAGRVLINTILLEHDLPPIIIRKTMRSAYFSALEASDARNKQKLERFIIDKFKNTFNKFFKVYTQYL